MLHRLGNRFTVNGSKNKNLPSRPNVMMPIPRTNSFAIPPNPGLSFPTQRLGSSVGRAEDS